MENSEPIRSERAFTPEEPTTNERAFMPYKVPPGVRQPDMIVNGVPHNCHPDCCGMLKEKEHLRIIEIGSRLLLLQELQSTMYHEYRRLAALSEQVDANIKTYLEAIDFIKTNALHRGHK